MEKINDGGSAFPEIVTTPAWENDNGGYTIYGNTYSQGGMSLRDYFAAKAMQAIWSDPGYSKSEYECAEDAYIMADAMLKVREEKNETS